VAGLRPAWTTTLPGVGNEVNASASVVVWRGVLYTGAYNGHVYAIRVSDGRVLWNVNALNEVAAALTIRRGIVYAETWSGVVALRAADGRQLWHRFDSFLTGSVAMSAGLAVIPDSWDVVALDARTGVPRWSTGLSGGYVSSSPAISGTTVLVTTTAGLTALDLESGRVLWQRGFGLDGYGDPVGSMVDPAVVDGVAYVADGGGILHAIDVADGTEIWSSDTGARTQERPAVPLTSPAVADGMIYLGTAEYDGDTIAGRVIASRAPHGELAWSHTVSNRQFIRSAPTVANGVAYDAQQSGAVFALDAETGARLWSSNTGATIGNASPGSSPVIVDGRLYIGTDDLRLHAFSLPSLPDSTARPVPSSLTR
jgi:outer membrane protein assembly factor BamB